MAFYRKNSDGTFSEGLVIGVLTPNGIVTLTPDNRLNIGGWEWHDEPPPWFPVQKIYTETPFEPWVSAWGEQSPVDPRSEGWVFPANVGWENELSMRDMEWEYIEVVSDEQGTWTSVRSIVGGYWDTIKGWFQ